jgi:hypothetical protein
MLGLLRWAHGDTILYFILIDSTIYGDAGEAKKDFL